jgi:hypothetical protein
MNMIATVESLEMRQLCSATPLGASLAVEKPAPAMEMSATPQRRAQGGVVITNPAQTLVGRYEGFMRGGNGRSTQFTLNIARLAHGGKLVGTIWSPALGLMTIYNSVNQFPFLSVEARAPGAANVAVFNFKVRGISITGTARGLGTLAHISAQIQVHKVG